MKTNQPTNEANPLSQPLLYSILLVIFIVISFPYQTPEESIIQDLNNSEVNENDTKKSAHSSSELALLSLEKKRLASPSNSGTYVSKTNEEGPFAITLVDNENNFVATIGYPESLPTFCGGDAPKDIVSVQEMQRKTNVEKINLLLKGSMNVHVFQGPLDTENFSVWCPFFEGENLLATGMINMHSSINENGSRWKWDVHFQGRLKTPEGEKRKVVAKVQYEWKVGEDFDTLLDLVKDVKVDLK